MSTPARGEGRALQIRCTFETWSPNAFTSPRVRKRLLTLALSPQERAKNNAKPLMPLNQLQLGPLVVAVVPPLRFIERAPRRQRRPWP